VAGLVDRRRLITVGVERQGLRLQRDQNLRAKTTWEVEVVAPTGHARKTVRGFMVPFEVLTVAA
jgi:hypothetical protein